MFIEHCPEELNVNFLAFDNYKSYFYLTEKLLEKGYEKIAIMTPPWSYSPAYSAAKGYQDAYHKCGRQFDEKMIIYTETSKESAFREAMQKLAKEPPQALITASEAILKGALEAFHVCGLKVPEDICVLTLGEETWNGSNTYPGVLHTSRSAYAMGVQCTELLMKDMEAPALFQKEFHLLDDNLEASRLEIPKAPARRAYGPLRERRDVLGFSPRPKTLSTIRGLQLLSENFTLQSRIGVEFELCTLRGLFDRIVQEPESTVPSYDICLFDVSWLRYMSHAHVLKDITELLDSMPGLKERFMEKNLSNCCHHQICYGIPVIGGTHLLFYRRDLFETPSIQREFQQQHHLPLRPP